MRKNERAGALLLPTLLYASTFAGSLSADYDAERRELEHVQVTATRRAASEFDVSAAVSQVDAVSVRAENPGVLAEMLRGLPGAFFQQTTPGQGVPIIRGLKGSQVLHLVDGMRLNNAFFRDAPNQYLGLVDAHATERVEVLRGAAGSLHGADAMGGVVQVLTPEERFEGPGWQSRGHLHGAFDSAEGALIGRASASAGREGMSLSGGITWQDRSDRETGGGGKVGPSGYRSEAADLKLLADIGERSELMISSQVLEQPMTPRVDELVPGYGQEHPSSEQYAFMPNRRGFLHARYRLSGSGRWLEQLEMHLARQVITDDRVTQDFGSTLVDREWNESVLDGFTTQADIVLPGEGLLTLGFEHYTDEVSSLRYRENLEPGPAESPGSRFPDGSSMDSTAAFVAGEWFPADRLTLGAGLRYSTFEIRLPGSTDIGAVRLTPSDLTGDLRLSYELSEHWRLVGNFGRGFRPPNIFDLATLGPRPGNRFNVPNPGLGPESVRSYDLGIKSGSALFRFELFAFLLDYRDKITSVATGAITPEGRIVVRSENRAEARLWGLESGLRWNLSDDTELYGVVNYTRGEETDESGMTLPGDRIPPLNGKLGLNWQVNDRWQAEGYWLFAANQDRLSPRDRDDPRIDPEGTAGWGTFNALLSWQASDALLAGIKLENLGDNRYREHGSGVDAPGRSIGLWVNVAW